MTIGKIPTTIDLVHTYSATSFSLPPSISNTLTHTKHTDVFGSSQLYIAFLLENSGMQLGSYVVSCPTASLLETRSMYCNTEFCSTTRLKRL